MKKAKKILLILFIFSVQIVLSQNVITYSNLSQTVTANPDSEVIVKVIASCSGSSTEPTLINPTFCVFDSGLKSLTFSNGAYLLPNQKSELIFKFKKTVANDETFTYKFSTNSSCFQPESQMIKITVNYKMATIPANTLPKPTSVNFVSYSDKIIVNWAPVKGAKSYYFTYLNADGSVTTFVVTEPTAVMSNLVPKTKYEWWIHPEPYVEPLPPIFSGSNWAAGVAYTERLEPPTLDGMDYFCSTATSGYTQRYAIFYQPLNLNSITWTVSPSNAVSALPGMGNDLVIRRASGQPFTITAVIKVRGKDDLIFTKNVSNSCLLSAVKKIDILNFPSSLVVTSACNTSGGICGIANFQWISAENSVAHEVEYMILNYNSNTPNPITGSFQTVNSFYTADNMYVNNNSESWRIKFRVRSKDKNGVWSDFSPWSANFAW